MQDEHEENRHSWNAAVLAHESHRGDQVRFFAEGGTTLFPEELRLLGDIDGQSIAHLQCNTGQDSLSLARLGATVVGVDLSDTAIERARNLSEATGIPATFVRADLFDWFEQAHEDGTGFDCAFASYGVVCWISDLDRWAGGIASILKPGGRFVLLDFHPVAAMFNADWQLRYRYGGGQRRSLPEGIGDYVGASQGGLTPAGFVEGQGSFVNPHSAHLYLWGLGEIITALAQAGLTIERLDEFPFSNGERAFTDMQERPGRRMFPPDHVPEIPLMFGLRARKSIAAGKDGG
jgi:SAM-dependent methyltransferase